MEPASVILVVILLGGAAFAVISASEYYEPKPQEGDWMPEGPIDQRGMKSLGPVPADTVVKAIVKAILDRERRFGIPGQSERLRVKVMGGGNLYGVDHAYHRYVEQDRTKDSPEAARVRDGATIVWIIKTHKENGDRLAEGKIIGRVEDGTVYMR